MTTKSSTHREYAGEGHYVTVQHCEREIDGAVCDEFLGYEYPSLYCSEHRPHAEALSTAKPLRVTAQATALVEARFASYDLILATGLRALDESRDSLFGYGVQGLKRGPHEDNPETHTGTFVVYAHRD